jgi:hypothetical protein
MPRCSRFALFVFALVLITSPAPAQETKTVTAEGVASFQQGALDIARDHAIEDALKRAVEQAIGSMVDSRTQVENYQAINHKILSQIKGYIERYHVIGEHQDSGLLRVRITADVAMGMLNDDLIAIGIHAQNTKETGETRPVLITITGLNKTQFVQFKDVLRNQVRSIKGLHERSFTGSTARISVDSRTTAQVLSDELVLRDLGTFSIEVVGSTANSLELRVKPRQ